MVGCMKVLQLILMTILNETCKIYKKPLISLKSFVPKSSLQDISDLGVFIRLNDDNIPTSF